MVARSSSQAVRTVAVLAFPGVQALDVVGPLEVFGRAARFLVDERGWKARPYRALVVAPRAGAVEDRKSVV